MDKYTNTIAQKGKVYEIYHTKNSLIKFITNRFLKKIENSLELIDAKNLKGIDIGCGEGHMLNILKRKDIIHNILGIDLDEERVSTAKENFGDIEFLVQDIYNLTINDKQFDYIIATEILEHLPEPETALNIFKELGKNNSYLIVSVPHEPYFQFGNVARGKHLKRRGKTPAHLNFWNKKEFEKLLKDNNIEIVQGFNISTFPWLLYLGRFTNS